MTQEQYTYQITFYLSDGKEVSGRITRYEDTEKCLKTLQELIKNSKTICIPTLGTLIRTKYITHVRIIEIKNENE
ncbi:hypothetical protein ABE273_16740 [Bacillus paranthracis]|uniref:hypothetical protein n=1 Tax=Bacillus cereus group TaxID=86661 RepID=UPI0022DED1F0|nr:MULTISPECIES: hypothetical protein [unclassified Bacillus cereus group]MDA2683091.1 hypothetical protein [Bacillus cereus group sp. Bc029]MDA2688534.1 hypothetical protein [Bacillus cereus group sp. Bc030]MDA2744057.1 hypothetical protein [Bacillus cereus group sp. Bc011]